MNILVDGPMRIGEFPNYFDVESSYLAVEMFTYLAHDINQIIEIREKGGHIAIFNSGLPLEEYNKQLDKWWKDSKIIFQRIEQKHG